MFGHEDKIKAAHKEIAAIRSDLQKLHTIMLAKIARAEIAAVKHHFAKKQEKAEKTTQKSRGGSLYRLGVALCLGYLVSALFREFK